MSSEQLHSTANSDEQASWNPALRPQVTPDISSTDVGPGQAEDGEVEKAGDTSHPEIDSIETRPASLEDQTSEPQAQQAPPTNEPAASSPVGSGDEWTAEDRIDPAWELPSPGVGHTNSFPPVPPMSSTAPPAQPLPHSQAEDIMEELEEETSMAQTQADPWEAEGEAGEGVDFFSSNVDAGKSIPVEPSDAEARFEEGIPLVQQDGQEQETPIRQSTPPQVAAQPNDLASSFADDAGDDFFTQVGQDSQLQAPPEPPTLDRKSTEQVISSMDFTPREVNHDWPKEEETPGMDTTFFQSTEPATEGGVDTAVGEQKDEDLAALWQAELGDDDLLPDDDDTGLDPSSFFEDDGEGFLEDLPESVPTQSPATSATLNRSTSAYQPTNSYVPTQTQGSNPQQSRYAPAATPSAPNTFNANFGPYGQQSQPANRPQMPSSAQSFADKAKGGYASPFDAPMDLSRPKRRPAQFQAPSTRGSQPAPPPRSSSIQSMDPSTPNQLTAPAAAPPSTGGPPQPPPKTRSDSSTFFEELPMVPKPRPSNRYSQPTAQPTPPPSRGMSTGTPPVTSPPQTQGLPQQQGSYGLVAPERVMSFGAPLPQPPQNLGSPDSGVPSAPPPKTAPPPNTRYSPAPVPQSQDAGKTRYATTSGPIRPPSVSIPHQPRTSSPLARSASVSNQYQPQPQAGALSQGQPQLSSSYAPQPGLQSPPKGAPPKRQSQGPTSNRYSPKSMGDTVDRPSVTQRGLFQEPSAMSQSPQVFSQQRVVRARGPSLTANLIPPTDGHEHDPLKRWQGAPIFNFGFGGSVTVSFPQRIPRFSSGQAAPMIKCSPGPVRVESAKSLPFDEHHASFPGPLKAKGKKKDVLDWLRKGIELLEQLHVQSVPQETPVDVRKRHEEKVLLWKILATMVEYDGNLETNPAATKAVRDILSPELSFAGPANQTSYDTELLPTGITPKPDSTMSEPAGVQAVESIRKLLLTGEREKAVWSAVDQKLWGHAMLISSTMSPEIRKQVALEFVKTDVKPVGDNTESLAALYDVFAGNWEESVDRLVPPSARAGLQMVSKTNMSGPAKNAFEGLDRWRETLSLIWSNRSVEDGRALIALGQLLSTYGRIEAAHICFLFSKAPGIFGGAEDPSAQVVLLGADHRQGPSNYGRNLESILLTEVYDFTVSVLGNLGPPAGHLQPFKLYHALVLTDHGHRDEAQQYCDLIASASKAMTKASPYYHTRLFAQLEDLNARLKLAPQQGSGSWISKPSMDKVSSSLFNKFTSFVAGDDSDAASVGSAQPDSQGPFARVSGDTPPTLSRSGSPSEGFGYGAGYTPMIPAGSTNSRYAPSNAYAPRQSLDQSTLHRQPSNMSMQSQGSPDLSRSMYSSYAPSSSFQATPPSQSGFSPMISSQSQFQSQGQPPSEPEFPASQPSVSQPPQALSGSPYEPRRPAHQSSPLSSYDAPPTKAAARSSSYGPRSYMPSSSENHGSARSVSDSYEPQAPNPDTATSNSYEPQAPNLDTTETYQAHAIGPETAGSPALLQTPSISQEPPTPVAAEHPGPSFGYEPSLATDETKNETSGYSPPPSSYSPSTSNYGPRSSYEPPSSSYEPPASSYEPPSSSYEPPSYKPYEPETNGEIEEPSSPLKKKKSFMDLSDDEDDLVSRASALKINVGPDTGSREKSKSEKDREAEEAFKRAAEADAARDKKPAPTSRGSWLGGWWGKGESEKGLDQPKTIKAKLGDKSAFYYDKNLGQWINPNNPDGAVSAAPTPPPPKGGPSRNASGTGLSLAGPPGAKPPTSAPSGPPMGPPGGAPSTSASRNVSPSLGTTPPMGGPGSLVGGMAPPSRPGTGMSGVSNASSIDDLLGVPQARKGGTMKGKKKRSGYVDIMAKD